MFYLVGLGLFDEKDISLKGLDCLKNVDKIYAEFFTSRLFGSSFDKIEELIGKEIEILVRNEVEEEHKFIEEAGDLDVALITGGDPLIATTHSDFLVQCAKKGIEYEVIHGSSILSSAPAISGLQGYKFGKVTTAHNNRYMTVNQGLDYLMNIKESLDYEGLITEDTLAVGIARVGSKDVVVKAGKISDLMDFDFGGPLHCIVIPADLHIVEAEYLVEIAGADSSILGNV